MDTILLPAESASPKTMLAADAFAVEAGTIRIGDVRFGPPSGNREDQAVWMELIRSLHDARQLHVLAHALE